MGEYRVGSPIRGSYKPYIASWAYIYAYMCVYVYVCVYVSVLQIRSMCEEHCRHVHNMYICVDMHVRMHASIHIWKGTALLLTGKLVSQKDMDPM